MKHLTVDEIIDFVSFETINQDTLALASKVNAHILHCEDCRQKVDAFQKVYDEFLNIGRSPDPQIFKANQKGTPALELDIQLNPTDTSR